MQAYRDERGNMHSGLDVGCGASLPDFEFVTCHLLAK